VLLISTLYRLALSVATTRMILLHGDAGRIVDTFGDMVAGGNLIVGMVVFLIITVVQFIVIAKGAERVAEVGARFSLDAMPGKQMSIDSDLRSGLLDKDEARKKRRDLELEAKLHGSMDGAMKFVKGDSIAGIIIIIVNLLGGLAVGMLQLDMELGAAMTKYSILTVGDGMVAQIPALLGAISAGLIVTRTTDEESDAHLGDSIHRQFTAIPRVSIVAGAVCCLFAMVPGFPSWVFLALGGALSGGGLLLLPVWKARLNKVSQPAFEAILRNKELSVPQVESLATGQVAMAVPLLFQIPRSRMVEPFGQALVDELEKAHRDVQFQLGISLPKLHFHWTTNTDERWRVLAFEVPIIEEPYPAQNSSGSNELVASPNDAQDIAHHFKLALRKNVTLFVGLQETSTLLTQASNDIPDIVKEVLRVVPIQSVTSILKNLVSEEVSIRNLRTILESLISAGQQEQDVNNLTEIVRISLARQISHSYAPNSSLSAVVLSQELEEFLMQSIRSNGGNTQFSIDPQMGEAILGELIGQTKAQQPQAVLCSVPLRRLVRQQVAQQCFEVPVLSYSELMPTIQLDVLHQVSLPNPEQQRLSQ
jgi:type III secretion protein V